ncbi:MAG: RNA polymerase sigma factor [Actinomycetota bacterium]|nr:RNA polymerase sigma factor [Actinomycetota bacterium]
MVPPPAASEDDLVRRAQQGERAATDELLRRHYDRVYAVCRRIAGNEADALDATQEALMGIVRGLPRFDSRARFSTWAYRVATNACLDELRRRRRRPEPAEMVEDVSDDGPAFEDDLAVKDELDRALAAIPEQFRAPLVLRDLAGLDYTAIAETLQIAPGTVRSRIARGRAALAREMTGNQSGTGRRPSDRDD